MTTLLVNKELHKNTQYMIPYLKDKIKEIKNTIATFWKLDEANWEGYNAEPITKETMKRAVKVLNILKDWFIDNIGFLNNREFKINVAPITDGSIELEIVYQCYILIIRVGKNIKLLMEPEFRYELNGHTIAERKFNLIESKNKLSKEIDNLEDIKIFLDEAFYKHRWVF